VRPDQEPVAQQHLQRQPRLNCGRQGFDLAAGSKNGEGVYIGTAPEQRYKIGGVADKTTGTIVENNVFTTNGSEAVDIKEDAEGNIVRNNVASGNRDPEGANFGVRGDRNTFSGNESFNSAGAGFRAGGDTVDGRVYGKNNVFRDNRSHDNALTPTSSWSVRRTPTAPTSARATVASSTTSARRASPSPAAARRRPPSRPRRRPPSRPRRRPPSRPRDGDQDRDADLDARRRGRRRRRGDSDPDEHADAAADPDAADPDADAGSDDQLEGAEDLDTTAFSATDDGQVAAHRPTSKYGYARTMRVDSDPQTITYLKFKVSGIDTDDFRTATLRVYLLDGGKGLTLHKVGATSWTEGGLTWNTRPRVGSVLNVKRTGTDAKGTWVEFDVSGLVTRGGIYSFALTSTSSDGYTIASGEATANRPRLVLVHHD
jgi:hypothetical protein